MKKPDELKPEYDLKRLGQGVRGKYYKEYQKGTNIDMISTAPNSLSVRTAGPGLRQAGCLNRL